MGEPEVPGEITALLRRWGEGDRQALAALASLAYDDLRNIAAGYLRRESRAQTLQATSLVNELYMRLARQREVHLTDRRHFYAFAALMLRRILTDHARGSRSSKRPAERKRFPCTKTWRGSTHPAKRCWIWTRR